MRSFFERLPGWGRAVLGGLGLGLAAIADLVLIMKTDPWRPEVVIYAALGALAAWPFTWRARTRAQRGWLAAAVIVFAVVAVWARVTGRIANSSAFFVFSALVLAVPVQRARGHEHSPRPPEDVAD